MTVEGESWPAGGDVIAALSLAIGLLFSLVCYLITNLSPGGMITPGWLALTLVQEPRRAAIVVCVTALTFLGTLGLQKVVIVGHRV